MVCDVYIQCMELVGLSPLATGHLMWVVVFRSHIRDIIELVKKVSNCFVQLWVVYVICHFVLCMRLCIPVCV